MIGAVENAIMAELRYRSDSGALGYRYATLETYPDDFDDYFTSKKGQFRAPAAWCVFLALDECVDSNDGQGVVGTGRFALVVAGQNRRNETATRHGGPDGLAEPGSYQLAIDAVRVLSGNWLDETVGLVRPISVAGIRLVQRTTMMAQNNLSLVAVELRCQFPLGQFPREGDGDFATLHVDWDVPPIGNVAPPLPAARADAADQIAVPQ